MKSALVLLIGVGCMFVGMAAAKSNQCMVNGCLRYAPAGFRFCSTHLALGKDAAAKSIMEAMRDCKVSAAFVRRKLRALDRDFRAAEAKASKDPQSQKRLKALKAEQEGFASPLEGLFGHLLGETINSSSPVIFEPKRQFREFSGYSLLPDPNSRKVVAIAAFRDFGNELAAARAELALVMDLLVQKYGRPLEKISSASGSELHALGFGAAKGEPGQMLQVSLRPLGKDGFRIVLSASVVERSVKHAPAPVKPSPDLQAL